MDIFAILEEIEINLSICDVAILASFSANGHDRGARLAYNRLSGSVRRLLEIVGDSDYIPAPPDDDDDE